MKKVRFTASESVEIPVEEESIPIGHYLRQPERLVRTIADPRLMQQLDDYHFRLKMRPIEFLDLYSLQPAATLKVTPQGDGAIALESVDCEIIGNDYINQLFSLDLRGRLVPEDEGDKTYLRGRADLTVNVELPPPLWLTPQSLIETTGNSILKGVLGRIKQRLLSQLIEDYVRWARDTQPSSISKSPFAPAENPTS